MTIQNPGDTPERSETVQREVLSQQYRLWDNLLHSKGEQFEIEDPENQWIELQHSFDINRSHEVDSKFTNESVTIEKLTIPIEEYIIPYGQTVPFPRSKPSESWIILTITPRNIYRPNIVKANPTDSCYYAECLEIFVSNHGRAYQTAVRREINEDEIMPEFKTILDQTSIATERDLDSLDSGFLETPSPLSNQNLERLMFIINQANRSDTSQGGESN